VQRQNRFAHVRNLADPVQRRLAEAVAAAKTELDAGNPIVEELVDLLGDEVEAKGGADRALRIIEILSELGCAYRILSLKLPLVAHEDERVRSKSVLLIGRELKSADWVMRRMLDPDPGVQANAIESVWGIQSPEMHRIMDRAARSRRNRVAANGLIGLYLLNDVSSIPRLFEMAEHPDEQFRLSARWAMGETRDSRFLPYLVDSYKRATNGSKGILFGAMARIRKQLNSAQEAGTFRLRAARWRELSPGSYAFSLSVSQDGGQTPPLFNNMNFVLHQESCLVTKYAVAPVPNPSVIVAAFAVPRVLSQDSVYRAALEEGMSAALKAKRPGDLWWIHRYRTNEPAHQNILSVQTEDRALISHRRANQNLLADESFINRFIPGPGRVDESSADIAAGIHRLLEMIERTAGERHIFICFDRDCPVEERALKGLMEAASECNTFLHGFIPGPHSDEFNGIRQLCESTRGTFDCLELDSVSNYIVDTYEQLLNRYEITYEAADASGAPDVNLVSQHGCAQSTCFTRHQWLGT
jgi:hypothetical protein